MFDKLRDLGLRPKKAIQILVVAAVVLASAVLWVGYNARNMAVEEAQERAFDVARRWSAEISAEVETAMGAAQAASAGAGIPGVSFDQPLRDARDAFEKAYLEYQLEKHGGNVSHMAEEAGMERTHLYRKLRDRGIEIKDRR